MQPLISIVTLTLKAALRSRLIFVLGVMLLGSVIVLPLIIRDDGTARGFTQIILTYTLSISTALLGLASLWMACGSLSRDIEECQMQLVAVKPVARWKIWFGKWLGIIFMNGILLGLSGVAVYFLVQWRARDLPPEQQEILRNEVLVARGSARMESPDIEPYVAQVLQERLQSERVAEMDRGFVENQIREQIKAGMQVIPPRHMRSWKIPLGAARKNLTDEPFYLRTKFYVPPEYSTTLTPDTYVCMWELGPPDSPKNFRYGPVKFAAETFHEFRIPSDLLDEEGFLTVRFFNTNEISLLFAMEDGPEVLYREGNFALNYFRGLGIILCWMGLLTSIGLAAASFMTFPVATFFCLGVLVVGFSGGILSTVVDQGTVFGPDHEGNPGALGWLNPLFVPLFHFLFKIINVVHQYSPIDLMSSGRSVTWVMLGQAAGWIVLFLGGMFALCGTLIFTRLELAAPRHHS